MNETIIQKHARRDEEAHPEPQRQKAANGKEIYTAFEARPKLLRLDIRKASGESRAPVYSSFVDIIYGRRQYSTFVLLFHHLMVTVTGSGLRPVIQALKANRCLFLEEISEAFEPPAAGEPVIDRIEFETKWKETEGVG
jgi:hypothetical protein